MANMWYLNPCCPEGDSLSEEQLYLLIYEITSHLDRAGVSFHVPERAAVFSPGAYRRREMGETIAKVIIKADGKEFVPVTTGEYIDQAISLGLFPRNTKWDSPMTKADAAVLAIKLKNLLERG